MIIILTNIIILISFTNYDDLNFKDIILFGYEIFPTNPSNQKFIFLLLNSFVLFFFMIENNDNSKFKLIVLTLIVANFLYLLRFANTYTFFFNNFKYYIYFLF